MSTYGRLVVLASGLCLSLTHFAGSSYALYFPPEPMLQPKIADCREMSLLLRALPLNFSVSVVVQYLVILAFLGRPAKVRKALFVWILFANLLTNPVSQYAVWGLGLMVWEGSLSALQPIVVVELAVVAVEFALLRWIFGRMYRQSMLDTPVGPGRTFMIACVANMASFVLGNVVAIIIVLTIFCGAL